MLPVEIERVGVAAFMTGSNEVFRRYALEFFYVNQASGR